MGMLQKRYANLSRRPCETVKCRKTAIEGKRFCYRCWLKVMSEMERDRYLQIVVPNPANLRSAKEKRSVDD
jgi:hypothetical protein